MQHSYNYTHFLIYFIQRYRKNGRMKRLCLVTVSPTARELHSTTRLKHCVFSTYISSQMTSGHPLIHRWFQAFKVLLSFLHLGARKQSYTKRLKWDSESAPGTDTPPSTSRWAVQVPLQTKQVPMLFSETVIIKSLGAAQELEPTLCCLLRSSERAELSEARGQLIISWLTFKAKQGHNMPRLLALALK